jgi:predicted nuclease of predicted toxin-antitoxin system
MALFFADECIAARIVNGLHALGFDIVDAKEVCKGDNDERALALAAASGRILITEDWGFGELAVRHGKSAAGVVILGVYSLPSGKREEYAVEKIVELADTLGGCITIIEPGRVRTRPLPKLSC